MKFKKHLFLLIGFLTTIIFGCLSQVRLPSIFTSNMVLQQKSVVPIWGWSKPGATVTCTASWNNKKIAVKANAAGKWKLMIQTPVAGGPYEITITDPLPVKLSNVLLGEVWLCSGQSNMEMPMMGFKGQPVEGSNDAILRSANNQVRLYTVPRTPATIPLENSKPSEWKLAAPETVSSFSATAYYFAKLLHELLQVPIGVINTSYGGSQVESWMSSASLRGYEGINIPAATDSIKSPNRTPTALFNGMVHPLIGYGIKGVTWYQGESNYDRPQQYTSLLASMVTDWRRLWNQGGFPFYYAQIAPFNYAQYPVKDASPLLNSAYLREAQSKLPAMVANTAMAVLLDAGDEKNIHPSNKKIVGERLAYLALANTYGIKGFGAESPRYDSLVIKDTLAIVQFKNATNWLTSFGKELTLFEVAGKDKIFYPARAVIYRSTVKVSSSKVRVPVAVRYGFKDFVKGELFGTDSLPVSSFRTDDW